MGEFLAIAVPLVLLTLLAVRLSQTVGRLIAPGRYDPGARALADVARRLRLPAPRAATRLAWPLPCGVEAQVEADEHLRVRVPLAPHLPPALTVDRPRLPAGVGLRQVDLPGCGLDDFCVLGTEADALGVLDGGVRRALQAAAGPGLHVAIEQASLRVELGLADTDLVEEATRRLDVVARAVSRLPTDGAARLAAVATGEEPRALRWRALTTLLAAHPEAAITRETADAVGADLDEAALRRWAGRHGAGALSLHEGDAGAVALVQARGALSEPED